MQSGVLRNAVQEGILGQVAATERSRHTVDIINQITVSPSPERRLRTSA